MTPILRVRDLVQVFGGTTAVDGLSFEVRRGEIFAFLGENGAGKTTTISCITGTLRPTSGEILIEGGGAAEQIGVVFQQSVLDPLLSARENLWSRGQLYPGVNRARVEEVIDRIGIGDFADRRYGVLTTHYMEETELADSVLIIDHGREVARGTPMGLRARHTRTRLILRGADPEALLRQLPGRHALIDGDRLTLDVDSGLEAARLALSLDGVTDVEIHHGSMDEVFLAVTGARAVA